MTISNNSFALARLILLLWTTGLFTGCATTATVAREEKSNIDSTAAMEPLIGRAVNILDGDTFDIVVRSESHRIRLAGIDCPEKHQAFGNQAKERLSQLIFGKLITVTWEKRDRYDRILGKVILNGSDVNLRLIQDGLAWFFRKHAHELPDLDRKEFDHAEQLARNAKIGLWFDRDPIPPWEFRRKKKRG